MPETAEPAEKSTFKESEIKGPSRRIWALYAASGALALLVAFLLLDYFNILPLAQGLKQATSFVPQAKIVAGSSFPNYRLKLTDQKVLEGYLNDWGFWDGTPWRNETVKPKQLAIVLAEEPGYVLRLSYQDEPDVIASASNEAFDEKSGKFSIEPYIAPIYLPGGEREGEEGRAQLRLNLLVLQHLFLATKGNNLGSFEASQEAWKPVAQEFAKQNKMFLEVSKN